MWFFGFCNLSRCSPIKGDNCSCLNRVPVSNNVSQTNALKQTYAYTNSEAIVACPFPVAKVNILPLNMGNERGKLNNHPVRKLNRREGKKSERKRERGGGGEKEKKIYLWSCCVCWTVAPSNRINQTCILTQQSAVFLWLLSIFFHSFFSFS